ncbi:hypothetical protein GCM10023195_42990 [Actinoallomurus liliacearum]|uniref:Uncharacterized protein n=1 Tax=Actinoallomurus liliacearum TaxID=1080073 RepID=A0ABP8TKI9_9ACTN
MTGAFVAPPLVGVPLVPVCVGAPLVPVCVGVMLALRMVTPRVSSEFHAADLGRGVLYCPDAPVFGKA